jgi:hypothetical protein
MKSKRSNEWPKLEFKPLSIFFLSLHPRPFFSLVQPTHTPIPIPTATLSSYPYPSKNLILTWISHFEIFYHFKYYMSRYYNFEIQKSRYHPKYYKFWYPKKFTSVIRGDIQTWYSDFQEMFALVLGNSGIITQFSTQFLT